MTDVRGGRRVLISPHLDDLALSCFAALRPGDVALTVFTAGPDGDGLLSEWDAECGATSSRELMSARRAEDRRALGLVGACPRHLPFAEHEYRPPAAEGDPGDAGLAAGLVAALVDELAGATEVWAPAAVYGNPDHALVRRVALAALTQAPPPSVWLYAEYPYHQFLVRDAAGGPPPAETVRQVTESLLAGWFHDRAPASVPARPSVRSLDEDALARKRQAVQCYGTQLAPIDRSLGGGLLDAELLRHEYAWQLLGRPTRPGPVHTRS